MWSLTVLHPPLTPPITLAILPPSSPLHTVGRERLLLAHLLSCPTCPPPNTCVATTLRTTTLRAYYKANKSQLKTCTTCSTLTKPTNVTLLSSQLLKFLTESPIPLQMSPTTPHLHLLTPITSTKFSPTLPPTITLNNLPLPTAAPTATFPPLPQTFAVAGPIQRDDILTIIIPKTSITWTLQLCYVAMTDPAPDGECLGLSQQSVRSQQSVLSQPPPPIPRPPGRSRPPGREGVPSQGDTLDTQQQQQQLSLPKASSQASSSTECSQSTPPPIVLDSTTGPSAPRPAPTKHVYLVPLASLTKNRIKTIVLKLPSHYTAHDSLPPPTTPLTHLIVDPKASLLSVLSFLRLSLPQFLHLTSPLQVVTPDFCSDVIKNPTNPNMEINYKWAPLENEINRQDEEVKKLLKLRWESPAKPPATEAGVAATEVATKPAPKAAAPKAPVEWSTKVKRVDDNDLFPSSKRAKPRTVAESRTLTHLHAVMGTKPVAPKPPPPACRTSSLNFDSPPASPPPAKGNWEEDEFQLSETELQALKGRFEQSDMLVPLPAVDPVLAEQKNLLQAPTCDCVDEWQMDGDAPVTCVLNEVRRGDFKGSTFWGCPRKPHDQCDFFRWEREQRLPKPTPPTPTAATTTTTGGPDDPDPCCECGESAVKRTNADGVAYYKCAGGAETKCKYFR